MTFTVCFIGGMRYSKPLDPTSEKKFRALAGLGRIYVIGFSADARPRIFTQHAHFYLLPNLPLPVLRYAAMFTAGPMLALWCVLRHGVRVLVAQSPYEGFAAAWAKLLARLLGRRVALVVESHGDFEVSLFLQRRVPFRRLYRFLMRPCARFALKQADMLRAVSSSTRQQLERWFRKRNYSNFPPGQTSSCSFGPEWKNAGTRRKQSCMQACSLQEKGFTTSSAPLPRLPVTSRRYGWLLSAASKTKHTLYS